MVDTQVPSLADTLEELHAALLKYVVMPLGEAADAVVLWIAATHAQPVAEHATRLVIKSPMKRCGKTRLLDLIDATAWKPIPTANISPAAYYRIIDPDDPPTLLLDEADAVFNKRNADGNEDLRGLLNAGFQRGRPVIRCQGQKQEVVEFEGFAVAALAAIGDVIPDTITDRAVIVEMRRRAPGETVTPYRRRRDRGPALEIGARLHEAVQPHVGELEQPGRALPVDDRAYDTWESLVAIADAAGGTWPERARHACVVMVAAQEGAAEDDDLGIRLLADLRTIFDIHATLSTTELLAELGALPESPWGSFEPPLNARGLGRRLRPYGVKPHVIGGGRQGGHRGYRRADLDDAWSRYLPLSPVVTLSEQVTQTTEIEATTDRSVVVPRGVVPLSREDNVTTGDNATQADDGEALAAKLRDAAPGVYQSFDELDDYDPHNLNDNDLEGI